MSYASERDGDGRRVAFERCEIDWRCDLYVLALSNGALSRVTTTGSGQLAGVVAGRPAGA